VLSVGVGAKPYLALLPTRAGESRRLTVGVDAVSAVAWFPDGQHVIYSGAKHGEAARLFVQDLSGGSGVAITSPGAGPIGEFCVSLDGRQVVGVGPDQQLWVYPVSGGEARRVAGTTPGDLPIRFLADGRTLLLFRRSDIPIKVSRIDLTSGKRELWREMAPGDLAGAESYFSRVLVTPDGKSYAYGHDRLLSELYLVDGLK
jgi:hypothetical protein